MSECIVRMKLPDNCGPCIFRDLIHSSGDVLDFCLLAKSRIRLPYVRRPEWCPIIGALPEKHGRLIDADALVKNHFIDEHRIALSQADKQWMQRIISEEPTIVKATDLIEKELSVTEIVRCRKCRFFIPDSPDTIVGFCDGPDGSAKGVHYSDFFCASGKPKEENR